MLGVLVALTSVGAGAIGVVALTVLYHSLSARRLVGTDIVHAIPLTFLAGASHFGMGNVDLKILGFLLIGSVPGIALGSRITGLVPDWVLARRAGARALLGRLLAPQPHAPLNRYGPRIRRRPGSRAGMRRACEPTPMRIAKLHRMPA